MDSHLFPLSVLLLIASWFAVGRLKDWLIQQQLVDVPDARKNHDRIVPRGAGLVLVPLILTGWVAVQWQYQAGLPWNLLTAACVLLILGSWDDRHELGAKPKLLVQLIAVALAMPALDAFAPLPWLPSWLWWVLMLGAYVWWVNLFNFMDGMDGISAWQAIALAVMVAALAYAAFVPEWLGWHAVMIAAVMLGFYRWNHHPAHIFLGDAGSLPIGLLLGSILMQLVLAGYGWLALLLPAYYWADASITLVKRCVQGKNITQAHSEHWYQRALRAGLGHKKVLAHILILYLAKGVLLLLWGMGHLGKELIAGGIALSVLALLLYWSYIIKRYEQC